MGSLISGFEYDIFISYRHNDNRSGWVTDFVNALQEELAATIKEPLSIYFDKNLHDGLLETHNVDKSLEGKLKCLIFIPIISQTYCDTKSFAWQHEFCAFNKLAKEDQFGRDVKLGNGNVASRILPIKIHELDSEDKTTIENEIGGVLRAIEFIYKEVGVNRPLRLNEENPTKNQNQTVYRNQVNKVANAVKEVIQSMKSPSGKTSSSLGQESYSSNVVKKGASRKVAWITMGLVILLFGIYAISEFLSSLKHDTAVLDKSIAVLPFADLSSAKDQEYLGDGIAEEIINVLAQSPELKVIARSSSFQFKGKNEDLRTMGKMLGVSTILEGSVRKFNNQVRVTAQLINVEDGSHFWSKNFDQNTDNIFVIQDGIAAEVAAALKATLVEGTKQSKPWNEEAQRLYQKGRFFYDRSDEGDMERAVEYFKQSVALDSSHGITIAYLGAAVNNISRDFRQNKYARMALRAEPDLPEARAHLGAIAYANLDFQKSFEELSIALEKGKSSPYFLRTATYFSTLIGNSKQAVAFARLALKVDPLIARSHSALLQAQLADKDYKEMLRTAEQSVADFPQNQWFKVYYTMSLALNGLYNEAISSVKDINDKASVLPFIYFRQNDTVRLDSILKTVDQTKLTVDDRIAYFALRGDKETFFRLIDSKKMDQDLLHSLRGDPQLELMRSDPRYSKLLEPYTFKGQSFSLN